MVARGEDLRKNCGWDGALLLFLQSLLSLFQRLAIAFPNLRHIWRPPPLYFNFNSIFSFLCVAILFKLAQVLLVKKACIRLFSKLGMPTWECMKIWCVVPTIANISHHPYHRRWCTIFKSVPFWRRKRHFWLFCRKLRHFLVLFLQALNSAAMPKN